MIKKFWAVVLVVALLTGLMTGCGAKDEEKTSDGATKVETTTDDTKATDDTAASTTEDSVEPVTLKWFSWNVGDEEYFDMLIDKFEADHAGVTVEIEYIESGKADDYMKKLDLMLLSGDKVDVVVAKSLAEFTNRAKQGLYAPLDSYMADAGETFEEVYTIDPRFDDNLYGLPADINMSFVYLNKDALDEAGLPVPDVNWTWDDYREYASKLTSGEGDDKEYGSFMATWGDPVHSYIVMNQTKEDNPLFYDEDTHALGDPKLKAWLEYRYALENEDNSQVPYYEISSMNLNYRTYFFSEKAKMLPIFGSWIYASIRDQENFPHEFVTAVAPLPTWEEGKEGWTRADSTIYSVNKNSEHPELSFELIRLLTTDMSPGGSKIRPITTLDTDVIVDMVTGGHPEFYDVDSIKALYATDMYLNAMKTIPDENAEIRNIFKEEQEEYLVGGKTIDECIEDMVKRADQVMGQ